LHPVGHPAMHQNTMRKILVSTMLVAALAVACNESQQPSGPEGGVARPTVAVPSAAPHPTPSATATAPATAVQQAAPTRIAAQHILVAYKGAASAPKGVTRTKEEARKRAEEASRKAKAGEDFSKLVGEYSDDATKADRGNLGMFPRESKVKPFADAAFALPVDGVSEAVETKFGFHVIKRNQ